MNQRLDATRALRQIILGELELDDPIIEELARQDPAFAKDVRAFLEDERRIREAGLFRVVPPVPQEAEDRALARVTEILGPASARAPSRAQSFAWLRLAATLAVSAALVLFFLAKNRPEQKDGGSNQAHREDRAGNGAPDTSDFFLASGDANPSADPAALAPAGTIEALSQEVTGGPPAVLTARTDGTQTAGDEFFFRIYRVGETEPYLESYPQSQPRWELGRRDQAKLGALTEFEWAVEWRRNSPGFPSILSTRKHVTLSHNQDE